jgi:hypothetical protein
MLCVHMEESGTQERQPSQVGLTGVGLKLPMTVSDRIVMSWDLVDRNQQVTSH